MHLLLYLSIHGNINGKLNRSKNLEFKQRLDFQHQFTTQTLNGEKISLC